MVSEAEKRRLPRYRVDFQVICRSRGREQSGRALNLSRGGVLVATNDLLPVGMLAEVNLAAPGVEAFQFKGIVRHAAQEREMGVEFLEVLPHHQVRLGAYLDTLGSAAGPATAAG